jgi:hypothetical protein
MVGLGISLPIGKYLQFLDKYAMKFTEREICVSFGAKKQVIFPIGKTAYALFL